MKIGEIWQDTNDGVKVKINKISWNPNTHDNDISAEQVDDIIGFWMNRKDFVIQYEKFFED